MKFTPRSKSHLLPLIISNLRTRSTFCRLLCFWNVKCVHATSEKCRFFIYLFCCAAVKILHPRTQAHVEVHARFHARTDAPTHTRIINFSNYLEGRNTKGHTKGAARPEDSKSLYAVQTESNTYLQLSVNAGCPAPGTSLPSGVR